MKKNIHRKGFCIMRLSLPPERAPMIAAICGDTMVWKPSSLTPLCAVAVQNIVNKVTDAHGLRGVFCLTIGRGSTVGERMINDRRIPLVSATGSTPMGVRIGEVVAKRLGRRFVGLERDETYAAVARKRIAEVRRADDESIATMGSKRDEPRIPFGWLVERGLLQPGEVLSDPTGRWTARVRADGTLISAEHKGSIHQVGAAVQGAPACNGWTFWCLVDGGKRVPIDVLRRKLRAELN